MPRYMALITGTVGVELTEAESGQMLGEYGAFMAEAGAAGVIAGGGEALQGVETATLIHVSGGKGGTVEILDSPYAEAKECISGYYLLDCADLDEAIAWAAKIPGAWHTKVEVRPVVDFTGVF